MHGSRVVCEVSLPSAARNAIIVQLLNVPLSGSPVNLLRRSAPYPLETLARVSEQALRCRASLWHPLSCIPGADVDASPGADVDAKSRRRCGAKSRRSCGAKSRRRRAASPGADVAVYPNILPFRTNMYAAHGSPLVAISALAGALADCRAARSDHLAGQVQRTDV